MIDQSPITVSVQSLRPSPWNPRGKDLGDLAELTASIATHGILQPLVVRPDGTAGHYQVVCGHRRLAAAKAALLEMVPATVRTLTDQEAMEIALIENIQRADLHPLAEATGYHSLVKLGKRTVAWIAGRVGKSEKYVYDRMKLLELTKEAQQLLWDGEIDAGHAILLARLTPAQQKQVVEDDDGLFDGQIFSFTPEEEDALTAKDQDRLTRKARTVRELQDYINNHFRFEPAKADTFLYPETVGTVKRAAEKKEKVVHITHDLHIQDDARDKSIRTITPRSWERADGKRDSETCQHSVIGVIVCGPGRGESFRVCIDKEKCKTHWGQWQKERARNARGGVGQQVSQQERWKKEQAEREEENRRRNAEKARWEKALPVMLKAVADRVKTMPTKASGQLAELILKGLNQSSSDLKRGAAYVSRGSRPEDLIRFAAFLVLCDDATGWSGMDTFPKLGKALGLDVKKILDAAAPAPVEKKEKPAAKANGKKKKAA